MISLLRDRRKVPAAYHGAKRTAAEHALLTLVRNARRNGNPKVEFRSGHWKGAKKQLRAEAHGKCAYCESPASTVTHADVEHFRPKSLYWWLAYCYDNYLYSCQICNQTYKKDVFPCQSRRWTGPRIGGTTPDERLRSMAGKLAPDPVDPTAGYALRRFLARVAKESARLLDPYVMDPEKYFAWRADEVLKEVTLVPGDESDEAATIVEAAENYYGLNREELRLERYRVYRTLQFARNVLEAMPGTPAADEAAVNLRVMMNADEPYAGMARYFVRVEWELDVG